MAFTGASGTNALKIPNDFFFMGFSGDSLWSTPHFEDVSGGLPDGTMGRIQRYTEPDSFGRIDARIISLSLVNDSPLFIDAEHSYNWTVTIASTAAMGQITIGNEMANGGQVIASFFDVDYTVEFTRIGFSEAPLSLNGSDTLHYADMPYWSNTLPGGEPLPDGNNFALGTDGTAITGATLIGESGIWNLETEPVPEPSTLTLSAFGAIGLLAMMRRKRRLAIFQRIVSPKPEPCSWNQPADQPSGNSGDAACSLFSESARGSDSEK